MNRCQTVPVLGLGLGLGFPSSAPCSFFSESLRQNVLSVTLLEPEPDVSMVMEDHGGGMPQIVAERSKQFVEIRFPVFASSVRLQLIEPFLLLTSVFFFESKSVRPQPVAEEHHVMGGVSMLSGKRTMALPCLSSLHLN